MSLTYRDAGVNIARAEDALSRVKDRIARTRRPEVLGDVGQFGGLFASPGADKVLVATTDGVGTKLEVARLLERPLYPVDDQLVVVGDEDSHGRMVVGDPDDGHRDAA